MNGNIFDISQYMTEDGPGIRTVVFFKGCPLRCKWCSNPYGLMPGMQLGVNTAKCVSCGHCIDYCPEKAIMFINGLVRTDFSRCTGCGACIEHCPAGARSQVGRIVTVDEVLEEVESARMFYRRGDGGLTLSGGEVLLQAEFAREILTKCRFRMINTAIETSAFGRWEDMESLISLCDTVFIDLKCMDPEKHRLLTGVSNAPILENARKAAALCRSRGLPLIFRLPLIPDLNDDTENISATADFVRSLDPRLELNVLPYHNLGMHKYEYIGREYELAHISPRKPADLERIRTLLRDKGIRFSIGGSNIQSY